MFTKHDISEVFLLSADEWEVAIAMVPNVPVESDGWWWLRSQGRNSAYAACVDVGGNVYHRGHSIYYSHNYVRPAFRIPHSISNNYHPGDKVTVLNTSCTVIASGVALADNIICQHEFDTESNNYNTSKIRSFIISDAFWELL